MNGHIVAEAYLAYRDQLYGFLVSLTHDGEAAEDLLHESYARLLREVSAGRAPENPRAWLYQVGRNLVTSRGRRQQVAERQQEHLRRGATALSAEEHCLHRERRAELAAILAELDWIDRTSLVMAAQGYSGSEIARAVGRSEGAVRTRLCRARALLRGRLGHGMPAGAA